MGLTNGPFSGDLLRTFSEIPSKYTDLGLQYKHRESMMCFANLDLSPRNSDKLKRLIGIPITKIVPGARGGIPPRYVTAEESVTWPLAVLFYQEPLDMQSPLHHFAVTLFVGSEVVSSSLQVKGVDHRGVLLAIEGKPRGLATLPSWCINLPSCNLVHGVWTCHLVQLENAGLVGFRKNLQTPKPDIRIENLHPYKIFSIPYRINVCYIYLQLA